MNVQQTPLQRKTPSSVSLKQKILTSVQNTYRPLVAATLLAGGANQVQGQMSHMAPEHPCIATQIELYGSIAPGDTVGFVLSGIEGANLSISDDFEIRLRRMENGQYVSGPVAVSGDVGDTLVIIGTGSSGDQQVINYCDFDCDPICGTVMGVLPIRLVSFNAYAQKDSLVFEWKTAMEENVEAYHGQVAPAKGNKEFRTVVGKDADGVDNGELKQHRMTVSLKDAKLVPGETYFARLQNQDRDGKIDNSPIVSFKVNTQAQPYEIELVPNPVSSTGKIGLHNLNIDDVQQIYLGSMDGTVYPVQFDNELPEIDLAKYHLPAGVYVLTAIGHQGQSIVTKKVVIGGR